MLFLAFAVSVDTAAVAIARATRGTVSIRASLVMALSFGAFQAGMATVGAMAGQRLARFAQAFDHWVAFAVLGAIGGKMLHDAWIGEEDGPEDIPDGVGLTALLALSVATSVDALAVGVTLPLMELSVPLAVGAIGIVTFALSFAGGCLGSFLGRSVGRRLTAAGGVLLIGLGTKVLVEHLVKGV